MDPLAGFTPVGVVTADARARIAFRMAGVQRDARYAVAVSSDERILLTPLATIPKRELLVWQNALLRESLARGLAESAASETVDLGHISPSCDDEHRRPPTSQEYGTTAP